MRIECKGLTSKQSPRRYRYTRPVILCAVPLLDVLGSKGSSQREDWQTMKYNWALQSRTLTSGATHYMSYIIKGLSTALDHFQEKILALEVPLGVQEIIREIFNF